MSDETIQERIGRAQSQDMDVSIVDTDPVVVQVHNEASDRVHTVIPDSVHCSCEDHTYRNTICKHLIELLMSDGHVGEVTREAVKAHREELELESVRLREQVEDFESEVEAITEALEAVGIDQHQAQTTEDVVEAIADGSSDDGFQQMVRDISGEQ